MPSKKSRIKFYADECFPLTSSTYLRSRGISITHAFDLNFVRKSDRLHLEKSRKLSRVLITLDRDFLSYGKQNLVGHPGVVVISVGSATAPNVNKVLDKTLKSLTEDYVKNSLIKITVTKIIKIKNDLRTEKVL